MQLARAVCGGMLALLAAGLLTGLAQAQTVVSGAIAADSRWTLANSPYLVSADIVVQGGATLTIDAGVLVSMAAGTKLTLQTGTLRALGTAVNPIRVLSERARLGQEAAAGDWDQWVFGPGTSTNTRLDHVQFEHGRGLLVQGCAPVLNHLDIRSQQGAAITIDLAASPTGVGNRASGNGLNGIAVPAGAITGSARWGLRGIPYVLSSGTVSVGSAPAISSVSPNVVEQGQSLQLSVNGARLSGVAAANLDLAGLSLTPASGGTSAQALLQLGVAANAALGPATLRLLVDAGEVLLPNALTVTPPIPAITSISPTSMVAGVGPTTLTLDGRNFLASSVVTANAAALPTEFVSTTQLRATLPLQTEAARLPLQVRSPNAQQPDQPLLSNTVTLTVQAPVPPVLAVEPTPLAIPPDSVTRSFQITLSKADFRDHTVSAATDHPAIATVSPASATIAAGQTRMLFQVTGKAVGLTTLRLTSPTLGAVSVPVFVTADYAGINSATAPVVGVQWDTATAPVSTSTGLYSGQVGLTFGSTWVDTVPRGTVKGGSTTLVLNGIALPAGLNVAVQPPEGVTLGAVTLNAEGTAASVPVSVAADAVPGMRRLVVTAGTQVMAPAAPGGDRFSVWYEPPVVTSVEPILGLPGSTLGSFVVRGRNLFDARPLSFSGDGITAASAPLVSADGMVVSTAIAISQAAAPGPRSVIVTTSSGDSGSTATSANTFSVIQQAGPAVSGLAAAVVGVTLEAPASPTSSSLGLVAPQVGVGLGSLLHAVQPATGATGQDLVLTLTGRELAGVTAAMLTPATGVTLGTPVPASDGLSVQLPVSIAADAPLAMRRLQLLAGATAIPVLQGADRFTVTAPVPVLDSVQPLVVPVGGSTTLTLRGIYLQNVTAVRLTPAAGIAVGTPVFNAADPMGPSLSVTLVVDATAAVGSRVVTAVAPAGESSGTAGVTNTITVAANAGTSVPSYLSAQVGVQLAGVATPVVPDPLALYSPGVGVEFTSASVPVVDNLGLLSPQVGIAYGPVLTSVEPLGLNVGQGGSVVVRGIGLPADAVLSFLPAAGIALEGAPVVAADGSSLTQAVSIAADAQVQPRAVILTSGGKAIPTAPQSNTPPGNILFSVGGGAPTIVSMSPILARQGEAFTLLLRGTQLQELVEVSAEPALGLQFGSAPVVAADGTQIEMRVFIAPDAPLGARVIRVRTRTGISAGEAGAANTFTVYSP